MFSASATSEISLASPLLFMLIMQQSCDDTIKQRTTNIRIYVYKIMVQNIFTHIKKIELSLVSSFANKRDYLHEEIVYLEILEF